MTLSRIYGLCSGRPAALLVWGAVTACPSVALSAEPQAISATAEDPGTGEVWIGTWGEGLYRRSAGRLDSFDQLNSGLSGNVVFDVLFVRGRVWAATNGGLSVYDPISREWELHFARRGDAGDVAIIELAFVEPFMTAYAWHGTTFRFDRERGAWQEAVQAADRTATEWQPFFSASTQSPPADRVAVAVFLQAHRTIALPYASGSNPGPTDRPDVAGVAWAVEHANATRAQKNSPSIELVVPTPGYATYGWGLPEDEIIGFARRAEVMGMVARVARRQSITDAVVARTGLPVVNVAGDENRANPWVFRCEENEPRRWRRVLDWLGEEFGATRFVAVVDPEPASRVRVDWWKDHVEKRGWSWAGEIEWDKRSEAAADTLKETGAAVVLSAVSGPASVEVLRQMRAVDRTRIFVGTEDLLLAEFASVAGGEDGRVVALLTKERAEPSDFTKLHTERQGRPPDETAVASVLAADHLLAAMETAGPSRIGVREALRTMQRSATGEWHYERLIPARPVVVAEWISGQWIRRELPP